jgi:hypothetical protein
MKGRQRGTRPLPGLPICGPTPQGALLAARRTWMTSLSSRSLSLLSPAWRWAGRKAGRRGSSLSSEGCTGSSPAQQRASHCPLCRCPGPCAHTRPAAAACAAHLRLAQTRPSFPTCFTRLRMSLVSPSRRCSERSYSGGSGNRYSGAGPPPLPELAPPPPEAPVHGKAAATCGPCWAAGVVWARSAAGRRLAARWLVRLAVCWRVCGAGWGVSVRDWAAVCARRPSPALERWAEAATCAQRVVLGAAAPPARRATRHAARTYTAAQQGARSGAPRLSAGVRGPGLLGAAHKHSCRPRAGAARACGRATRLPAGRVRPQRAPRRAGTRLVAAG